MKQRRKSVMNWKCFLGFPLMFICFIAALIVLVKVGEKYETKPIYFSRECKLLNRELLHGPHSSFFMRITTWDCGEYGCLTTEDDYIFRWAKPLSWLQLQKRGNLTRIVGIVA